MFSRSPPRPGYAIRRVLTLLPLLAGAAAWADRARGEAPTELPAVQVLATPIIEGNQVDTFGGVSTVVGQEQVLELNAQDLPAALRRTPGVTISRYNPIGAFGGGEGGAVFVRGMGSSRPGGEGVRYYSHNQFQSEWAPQAGLVLTSANTELHASYSRGVNYPGLNVVIFSQSIIPALGTSWENLVPETLNHFEFGVSQRFTPRLRADVTLFSDQGNNRYVIVQPPPPPPRFTNIESFRIDGAELTVTADPLDNLSLFSGLTLLATTPSGPALCTGGRGESGAQLAAIAAAADQPGCGVPDGHVCLVPGPNLGGVQHRTGE